MNRPARPTATQPTGALARLLFALVAAAVLAMVIWQASVAADLLRARPEVGGFDALSARPTWIANAVLVALTTLLAAFLPERWRLAALLPGLLTGGALLAASLLFGHTLGSALLAALTLLAGFGCGRWLLDRIAPARGWPWIADLVVGLGALGLGLLLLGRLGLLAWWSAGVPTILLGIAGAVAARRALPPLSELRPWAAATPVGVGVIGVLLVEAGWIFVWISAPDIMFDALAGKAFLPELWAETGRIGKLVTQPVFNTAGLAQILAIPGHTLNADDVGRWLQAGSLVALTASVWQIVGVRTTVAGPLAALVVGATPILLWGATTSYDDNVLALGGVAIVGAVLATLDDDRTADLRLALAMGLLAGGALWLKMHLLVLAAVATIGWVVLAGSVRQIVPRGLATLAGVLLVAAPAFVLRWIDTGNPVFPSYNDIFKSRYYIDYNETFNFPFWPEAGWGDLRHLFRESVLNPGRMTEAVPPGAFGLLVLAVLLALLIGWAARPRRAAIILWATLGIGLLFWWVQFRYLRYALPLGLLAVVLVARTLADPPPRLFTRSAALGLVAVISITTFASSIASFWNVPNRQMPYGAAFGRWDRVDYLRTVFAEWDVLQEYKRRAPVGADALSDASQRVFVGAERDLSDALFVNVRLQLVGPVPDSPPAALRQLHRLGIDWAVTAGDRTTRERYPWSGMVLDRYATPVWADRGWTLSKLEAQPARPTPLATCDPLVTGKPGCWNGADKTPGVAGAEGAYREIPICSGKILAVRTDVAGTGAVNVTIDANGTTGKSGFTYGNIPAEAKSRWVYATIPKGSDRAMVTVRAINPTARATRIITAELGSCAR